MIEEIQERIQASILVKQAFTNDLIRRIESVSKKMIEAYQHRHKVIFMGNGGSAADAQHLAAELVGRFAKDRRPLPALALHTNTSSLTALSNDYSYEQGFSKQIEAFANEGDVVVGISTSGNSKNVIEALKQAGKKKALTVALTGQSGGEAAQHADILLNVPSTNVARIQESHILIGHIICEMVESSLFP